MDDVLLYVSLIIAVILHEVSHGLVALMFGDDTAKRAGRLTLNPIPHVDFLGSIILPVIGIVTQAPVIGWAKPVPVNPEQLHSPRRHMLYVGLAGPATNLVLMFVAALIARILFSQNRLFFGEEGVGVIPRFALTFAFINLLLAVFNLLPIPPLDGSSLIERLLPDSALPRWNAIRPYGFIILFAVVFWTGLFGKIVRPFQSLLLDFIFAW
ncbi:MAG: site-2 protease family protein [Acidimicrobiales bacterium]